MIWGRVHPESASSPVITDKWQECLAEPIANFSDWPHIWWSRRSICHLHIGVIKCKCKCMSNRIFSKKKYWFCKSVLTSKLFFSKLCKKCCWKKFTSRIEVLLASKPRHHSTIISEIIPKKLLSFCYHENSQCLSPTYNKTFLEKNISLYN